MFRWNFIVLNLLGFFQGITREMLRDTNAQEVEVLWGVLWVCFTLWSSGFLKKYLPFSFKKPDKVFNKMIKSREQQLFCAESYLMSFLWEGEETLRMIGLERYGVMGETPMLRRTYYTLLVEKRQCWVFCPPLACIKYCYILLQFFGGESKITFAAKAKISK